MTGSTVAVSGRASGSSALDRSVVVRATLATAGAGIVAVSLARTLGPTLVDLAGETGAGVIAAVTGVLLRALAGAYAGALGRARHVGSRALAASCGVGAALGYLVMPGLVGLLGLAVTAAGPASYLGLLGALLIAAATGMVGALIASAPGTGRVPRRRPRR